MSATDVATERRHSHEVSGVVIDGSPDNRATEPRLSARRGHAGSREEGRRLEHLRSTCLWGAVAASYSALVTFLTWPLLRHPTIQLPDTWISGRFDQLTLAWALSWQAHALMSDPGTWGQGNIFYPATDALFYGEAGFGALPFFAPVFWLTGNPVLAMNLMFVGCIVLTALALHFAAWSWTRSHAAGVVAAATFLGTRWVLWAWVSCAPTYAVLQYLPLIVVLAAAGATRAWRAALLAMLVCVQALTSIYVAIPLAVTLSVIFAIQCLSRRTRQRGLWGALALTVGLAMTAPAFWGYVRVRLHEPSVVSQTSWAYQWRTVLPWGPIAYWSPTGIPLMAILLALAAIVLRNRLPRDTVSHAVAWSAIGLVLSLSAGVEWNGHVAQVSGGTIFAGSPLRISQRLGVGALIGLSLLAGLGVAAIGGRWRWPRRTALGAIALLCIYVEYRCGAGSGRYAAARTQTYRVLGSAFRDGFVLPASYLPLGVLPRSYPTRTIAPIESTRLLELLRSGSGPVLEVPISKQDALEPFVEAGGVGRPSLHAEAMLRSTYHWRPLLNGHSSFYPKGFRERVAWMKALPDEDAVKALERQTGLRTIVVHLDLLSEYSRNRWLALGASGAPQLSLSGADGDVLVFSVLPLAPDTKADGSPGR